MMQYIPYAVGTKARHPQEGSTGNVSESCRNLLLMTPQAADLPDTHHLWICIILATAVQLHHCPPADHRNRFMRLKWFNGQCLGKASGFCSSQNAARELSDPRRNTCSCRVCPLQMQLSLCASRVLAHSLNSHLHCVWLAGVWSAASVLHGILGFGTSSCAWFAIGSRRPSSCTTTTSLAAPHLVHGCHRAAGLMRP